MIKRNGDVFTTEAAFIGHGVNLRGVMGAGIAKTIKQKFPNTYQMYKDYCDTGVLKIGGVLPFKENGVTIVNLATQDYPGPDARYDAVFDSCLYAAKMIKSLCGDRRPVLAIPQIGCGIGGLEWDKVETLLKAVEILVPGFQFEVWTYAT